MVQRLPAARLLVTLEHREVDDPERMVQSRGPEPEAAPQLEPQLAERLRDDPGSIGDDQQQVAGRAAQPLRHGGDLGGREELRDR
jgi:hypothetical protein